MKNEAEQGFLEKVFHPEENHAGVRTEIIARITTFTTVAYILAINSSILSATGMSRGAIFTATALASPIITLLMTALANYPFVFTPGMGLNVYFAYTIVLQTGYSWEMALVTVSVESLIFATLSLTSVRKVIFSAILMNLKHVVSAGIRLFIVFIGLQNVKIAVESVVLVSMFSFKGSLGAGTFSSVGITVLLALVSALITGILAIRNVKGNIPWRIPITWLLGITYEITGLCQPSADLGMFSIPSDFSSGSGIQSMAPTPSKMGFSGTLSFSSVTTMFAFLSMGTFGTLGTLIGAVSKADMLDGDGKLPKIKDALMADAVGASLGVVFDTSTTTTSTKSASDVAGGGRTDLTSVATILFFGLSLFLSPIFLAIPSFTTAPALIIVGFLVVSSILRIDFNDFTEAVSSYIAIIAMPLVYSTSESIAMGAISYVVINLTTGHAEERKTSLLTYVLAVLFVLKYVLI